MGRLGGHRGCGSCPDAAPGSRAYAHHGFRGTAQLWVLPDQQPLRLRRGAETEETEKKRVGMGAWNRVAVTC